MDELSYWDVLSNLGSSNQSYSHWEIQASTQDRTSDVLVCKEECETSNRLIEYMARNRNRFLLVMNNDGDILNMVRKNGPLTIFDRQKHHIENIIGKGDFSRFSEHPNNEATQALIAKIEENQRRKILWNIKHPEISGVYIYTNSKDKKLVVQIKGGKVISIDPIEYNSPQQRWAIQKKLNKFGKDTTMERCSYGAELFGLYAILHEHEAILIDTEIDKKKLEPILVEIFSYMQSQFPEIEFNWDDDGKKLNKAIMRIYSLAHNTQRIYPLLWDKCEFIKTMINNIKDILPN